jgi:Fe-S cluster assembly protein SufD
MSSALAKRIAADFAAAAHAPQDQQRQRALQTLAERGLPTSRDENWKYVNLRPLEKVRFAPPAPETQTGVTAKDLPDPIAGYARYTFVDGVLAPALSATTAQAGVSVRSIVPAGDFLADPRWGFPRSPLGGRSVTAQNGAAGTAPLTETAPDLRFALLNEVFATDGALIEVAPGVDCQNCLELVFVATSEAKAGSSYPRMKFRVGAGAQVGLIERHISVGSDANFVNSAVEVEVGRDATLQHYRLQQIGARALWFDTLTANLDKNARYQVHTVSLGALSARSTVHVQLTGEQAEVGVFGVSVGGKNQVHDTFALIEHIAANARTEQSFRGISSGRARVAFNGKIIVHKGAHGTDSRQSLRGLLAGTDAEIDVRPQLEIYTDDVRCNHGATVGKLDDNMLFYLLSRGLDRETAQRLLKWAFLEDVVAKIEVPELRRQIEQSLVSQLDEAAVLKELL